MAAAVKAEIGARSRVVGAETLLAIGLRIVPGGTGLVDIRAAIIRAAVVVGAVKLSEEVAIGFRPTALLPTLA